MHVVSVKDGPTPDADPIRSSVSSFFPMPLDVAPLGPDASMSLLVNASRWHMRTLAAGTRLILLVALRDRFGNACTWAYEESR